MPTPDKRSKLPDCHSTYIIRYYFKTPTFMFVYMEILARRESINGISSLKLQIIYHNSFVADCGPPPVVVNATAAEYSTTLLGSTATYTCNVGFEINGSGVISCLSSGWEGGPQCVTGDDWLRTHRILLFVFACSVFHCFLTFNVPR